MGLAGIVSKITPSLVPHWCFTVMSSSLCSLPGEASTPGDGVPLTVALGTVDDAYAALWAVVGEHQDVKEVLLCWVALQDLLVHILHRLQGDGETL